LQHGLVAGGLENIRRFGSQRLSLPVSLAPDMKDACQSEVIIRPRYSVREKTRGTTIENSSGIHRLVLAWQSQLM
jgi:hypothetical protein